ncbi:cytochrome P450 [Hesseltinella vesiculosa]|uniref:Cytochrome P450 n=1 Tax=Hesseltinella vesiculosa TaxID=101127 RepID=A0A1X2GTX6_9FUNG|nr:cytochrome P450 [Hesseltinella vesiculosa]
MSDTDYMKYAVGAAVAGIAALAAKYPDRAIFDEHNPDTATGIGYPLVGALPFVLNNKHRIHELMLIPYTNKGALTISSSMLFNPHTVQTIDPANIEHVLKTNFENYVKGPKFNASTEHILGHGIFNANGEQWRWQRKAASLIFNVKNFRDHFTDVFVKEMHIMCGVFDDAVKTNKIVDLHDMMFRFTLDSFVYLGFGVDIKSLTQGNKVPFAASFDELQLLAFEKFINPFLPMQQAFNRIFHPTQPTVQDHLKVMEEFTTSVIAKRRKELAEGLQTKDLLSRFMSAHNERGEELNDIELRDTILNFIIAGRDTTAQALSWAFYCLAQNPRVEEKLVKEINEHIPDELESDSSALYEAIKEMSYAHAVLYEVLRLYPSVPANQKYALEDDIWPDGTFVKKGHYVVWNPYAQGRCETVWGPDAKHFKPERWITPEGELRRETQGKWPAFHVGPRVCLGQNLATLEALVALSMLLKRFKFTLVPGQNITYNTSLTLPMKDGLRVMIEHRK